MTHVRELEAERIREYITLKFKMTTYKYNKLKKFVVTLT